MLLEYEGLWYTALKLNKKLMSMLKDGGIQETLSNMLKYSEKGFFLFNLYSCVFTYKVSIKFLYIIIFSY